MHGGRVGEMPDLALAGRNALADGGQEPSRDVAPFRPRQRLEARPPERNATRVRPEPLGGLVDHRQRRLVTILRGRPPGEEAVAAEHDALVMGIRLGHCAKLQAKVEPRPLPRQKAELAAINLMRERFGVFARRDRDDRVGVNVIDMRDGERSHAASCRSRSRAD